MKRVNSLFVFKLTFDGAKSFIMSTFGHPPSRGTWAKVLLTRKVTRKYCNIVSENMNENLNQKEIFV